ncbi:MAG: bifunctional 5,10-methylene-tetrahydrofolate dehydrogenase/5,10-methylene-tetrahydrofolate cyclohydrolase [Candidatus Eisenbacteria bacterium]|nr:bifunctional 5,10-methylene-tetrahydrofolate dehydrogenase/5,10-methylene-tetrahydrofolate cyclohydrolase [Candidatus Eisenbacteria bacterium]
MKTIILEGKPIAEAIRRDVAERAGALRDSGRPVALAIVLAGEDPASRIYSKSILKAADRVGVDARLVEIPADGGREDVGGSIRALSEDEDVSGIIVQQPLPDWVPATVVEEIAPWKDVDGATDASMGRLFSGRDAFAPATALGVVEMLAGSRTPIESSHVAIVGRSAVVGRPLAALLLRKCDRGNATVTVCHSRTRDLAAHTRAADVVVAAMGSPEAVRGEMVGEGAVVIDVGVNRVEDPESEKGYRIVGDVAFEEMLGRAAAVTPVPGGVGRLTTAILLRNAVVAAESAAERAR